MGHLIFSYVEGPCLLWEICMTSHLIVNEDSMYSNAFVSIRQSMYLFLFMV